MKRRSKAIRPPKHGQLYRETENRGRAGEGHGQGEGSDEATKNVPGVKAIMSLFSLVTI